MTTYEYRVVVVPFNPQQMGDVLNQLGGDGWQLTSWHVVPVKESMLSQQAVPCMTGIFMRAIRPETVLAGAINGDVYAGAN